MPEQPRDIYVMRSDGSEMTRLTDGRGHAKHASWSPDGRRIAFVSDRDGNDEIYLLAVPSGSDAGGGSLTRLTDSPADDVHPTWSADGSCLAFTSYLDDAVDLSIMNADGTGLRRLADNGDWTSNLSWSP
jgi:Tol biopolymer transport system component